MKKNDSKKAILFLSVIIAIFLWFFAMEDINPIRSKDFTNIPVNYYGLREGLVLTEKGEKLVNIRISGRRNEIKNIDRNDFNIDVDLSKYGAGEHNINFYARNKTGINNLKIDYKPNKTEVKIEKLLNKTFDIKIEFKGRIPEGFDTERIALSSNTCSVEGAESIVKSIEKIIVYIDTNTIKGNSQISKEIIALDKDGNEVKDIDKSIQKVNIMIPYEKSYPVKVNPKLVGKVEEGFILESYSVKPETISLIKNSNEVKDISAVETEEFDLSNLKNNTEKTVKLIIPEGYSYNGNKNVTISLVIIKKEEDIKKDEDESEKNIQLSFGLENIIGKSDKLNIDKISNNIINVTLVGKKNDIDKVDPSMINLISDISNLNIEGEYSIPISVNIENSNIKIKSIVPDKIKLKLKGVEQKNDSENLKIE